MSWPPDIGVLTRRRRREGGKADPFGAGNTALINALGGNSAVLAFYDARLASSVTLNGSTVSAWADVRGSSGFGPTMSQATGTRQPTWDGVNLQITGSGSTCALQSASSSSSLDISGAVALIVVANTTSASLYLGAINDNGVGANGLWLGPLGTSSVFGKVVASTNTQVSSTVTNGATRRLWWTAKDTGTLHARCPTTADQTIALAANPASGARFLSAFNNFNAGANGATSATSIRAMLALARVPTSADISALESWATTYHGVVLA